MTKKRRRRKRSTTQIVGTVITALVAMSMLAAMFLKVTGGQSNETNNIHIDTKRYANIPRGTTEDGLPYLGNPDAPVVVEEFSDFTCPFCTRFHAEVFGELVERYVADGRAQVVFIPMPSGHTGSDEAARASMCALGEGKFWEMHDILFELYGDYGGEAFTAQDTLLGAAKALDIAEEDFLTCLFSPTTTAQLEVNTVFTGARWNTVGERFTTPRIFVNGDMLSSWADTLERVEVALEG